MHTHNIWISLAGCNVMNVMYFQISQILEPFLDLSLPVTEEKVRKIAKVITVTSSLHVCFHPYFHFDLVIPLCLDEFWNYLAQIFTTSSGLVIVVLEHLNNFNKVWLCNIFVKWVLRLDFYQHFMLSKKNKICKSFFNI